MTNEQGIFPRAITWLFGANWKTSASGLVTIIAYLIHDKPVIIHWLPEPLQTIVWNVAEYVFLGGFIAFARQVKDKNVSGGNIQQDATGAVAKPQEALPPPPEAALPKDKP